MASPEYLLNKYDQFSLGENFQPNSVLDEKRPFREKLTSFINEKLHIKEGLQITKEALIRGAIVGVGTWAILHSLSEFIPSTLPHVLKEITSPQMILGISATVGVLKSVRYVSDRFAKQWYGNGKEA